MRRVHDIPGLKIEIRAIHHATLRGMANQEHYACLMSGVKHWNNWRKQHAIHHNDLSRSGRRDEGSRKNDLEIPGQYLDLSGSDLRGEDLRGANLNDVDLSGAILSDADLCDATLINATLIGAQLVKATVIKAKLDSADLRKANLSGADLSHSDLSETVFRAANLNNATLYKVRMIGADLSRADLFMANLTGSDLRSVDLRSACLQNAVLDDADISDTKLWETQRANWFIKGIICTQAYWDRDGRRETVYKLSEFEKLHSDQPFIELFYEDGINCFELKALPALLCHLVKQYPNKDIRLKSIEEAGGGAKICVVVRDASPEILEEVKEEAELYRAQLLLLNKEIDRLKIEKDSMERTYILSISAIVSGVKSPYVFNGPTAVVSAPGDARVNIRQIINDNDNSKILELLREISNRQTELQLAVDDSAKLESAINAAADELNKQSPNQSVVSSSIKCIKLITKEALKVGTDKLIEEATKLDWYKMLNDLIHIAPHLKC